MKTASTSQCQPNSEVHVFPTILAGSTVVLSPRSHRHSSLPPHASSPCPSSSSEPRDLVIDEEASNEDAMSARSSPGSSRIVKSSSNAGLNVSSLASLPAGTGARLVVWKATKGKRVLVGDGKRKKRRRCGLCDGCKVPMDCGQCRACQNPKRHQVCRSRRCLALEPGRKVRMSGTSSGNCAVHLQNDVNLSCNCITKPMLSLKGPETPCRPEQISCRKVKHE